MVATDQQLEQKQLEIEQGFVEAGVKRLRRRERATEWRNGRAATKVGRNLVRYCFYSLNMQSRTSSATCS